MKSESAITPKGMSLGEPMGTPVAPMDKESERRILREAVLVQPKRNKETYFKESMAKLDDTAE